MTSLSLPSTRQTEFAVVASITIFVALIAGAAVVAGGPEIWRHVTSLSGSLLTVLLFLSLVNYAMRTLRWHMYSRHLGLSTPVWQSGLAYISGFALTTTPGRVGEAFRLWFLERVGGYRYERTVPLLLADRVSDMGAVGLLLLAGLAAVSAQPWLLVTAVLATSLMLLLALWPESAAAGVGLVYRLVGRWPRLFGRVRSAARRTASLFTPKLALATLILALAGWAAECLALFLLLQAFGVEVGFFPATLVFTAGMLVGALTLVPGGVGGTEATMLALLSLQGVPMAIAIPAILISRVTTLWFAVALGFTVMPYALRLARLRTR